MIPTEDTAPVCTGTGGDGTAIIHLNGQFATRGYRRKTTAELGPPSGWCSSVRRSH